ncbi:uncharacterized protein LOC124359727 isoform X1 [Homalodisca vitripennis]|uniref:uncharacterized protein LOC124359727 isoform X1 n=1 Tax=Homalodisca vitripennis TaxID=197043 RepID=UPI001EECD880|nr:uncharacterized protein LOC124359727 isoform X1 [Homalodisca vitripennis]
MIYCSVNGCYSNDQFGKKRKFYKFPVTYERSKVWHKFCCDPTQDRRNRRYICDLHFLDSDYDPNNLHRLRRNAVPSINGPERKSKYPSSTLPKGKFVLDTSLDCALILNGVNTNKLSEKAGDKNECTSTGSNLGDQLHDVPRYFVEHNYSLDFSHSMEIPQEHIQPDSSNETSIQSFQKHIHPINKCFLANQKHHQPVISTLNSNNQENKKCEGKEKHSEIFKTPSTVFNKLVSNGQLSENSSQTDDEDLVAITIEIPSCGEYVATSNLQFGIANVKSLNENSSAESFHHLSSNISSVTESRLPLQEENEIQSSGSLEIPPVCSSNTLKNGTINYKKRKLVKKYKNIKKRYLGFSLNPDNPKYSIAATAQSLGKNSSSFLHPIDHVDLNKGEWYKLYTPSGVSFPKMTESHIGPMVNQLRAKLPVLNDRDKLEVSFILSMMSIYPDVPKPIKEQMFQRLSLVFIATMFKWDTAIALAMKDENYPPFIPTGSSHNTASTLEDVVSNVPTVLDNSSTEFRKELSNTISKCDSTKSPKEKKPQNRTIPIKTPPHFPFEIIVQGKGSKTKKYVNV